MAKRRPKLTVDVPDAVGPVVRVGRGGQDNRVAGLAAAVALRGQTNRRGKESRHAVAMALEPVNARPIQLRRRESRMSLRFRLAARRLMIADS